jgi:hypothetical protein
MKIFKPETELIDITPNKPHSVFTDKMNADVKKHWRQMWIDEWVIRSNISECNFVTLPGPYALDVNQLKQNIKVERTLLFEKVMGWKESILSSVREIEKKKIVPKSMLGMTAGINQLNSLLKEISYIATLSQTKHSLAMGQLENWVTDKNGIERLRFILNSWPSIPVVINMDFCGAYTQERHEAIVNLGKLMINRPNLHNSQFLFVINCASPMGFKTPLIKDSPMNLENLVKDDSIEHKRSRFSGCRAIVKVLDKFGAFLEGVSKEVIKDLGVENETVSIFKPLHYQNGKSSCGYTTNGFTFTLRS